MFLSPGESGAGKSPARTPLGGLQEGRSLLSRAGRESTPRHANLGKLKRSEQALGVRVGLLGRRVLGPGCREYSGGMA